MTPPHTTPHTPRGKALVHAVCVLSPRFTKGLQIDTFCQGQRAAEGPLMFYLCSI